MRNFATYLVCLAAMIMFASCSGSSAPEGPVDLGDELPELEYDLVTDPGSTVSAADVDGEMLDVDDALNARIPSALPSGYQAVQGMYFTPPTPPGGGFSGLMTLRITMGRPGENEYDGVRLFLFYIHPTTLEAISLDSARANGNWVTFDVNALGHFVIAENLSIPRPNTVFTVSAFADLAMTNSGTQINFWAIAQNGVEPYSYSWDFDDGSSGSGVEVSHTYATAGTFEVTVTATDASGDTAFASSTPIGITQNITPLTGVVAPVTPDPDDFLLFTYGATVLGGDAPFTYAWDFTGDGFVNSTSAPPVVYQFATKGVYEGTLTVRDSNGATAQTSFTSNAMPPAPIITSLDPPEGVVGDEIIINGLNFGVEEANDGVWLDAVKQQIVSWVENTIVITISPGSVDGALLVRKHLDSNALGFKVIPRSPDQPGGGQI